MKNNYLPAIPEPRGRDDRGAIETFSHAEPAPEPRSSGFGVNDILFMLFRHKWKIALCSLGGILAAGAIFFILPFKYESQAKLLVRYVVDRSAIDGVDQEGKQL